MAQYYVGVDVGGTTVKMGMFSDGKFRRDEKIMESIFCQIL